MFDEVKMRIKVATYLKDKKQMNVTQIPVEVEKLIVSLKTWCSRFCLDKDHNDRVMAAALEELMR